MPEKIPHLDGPRIDIVVVVEFYARDLTTRRWETLRYASRNVRPVGVDPIPAYLASAPTWGEAIWGEDHRPLPVATSSIGQITLFNNGALSHLRYYEFARGTARVLVGRPGDAWADYVEVFTGRLGGREWSADGRQMRVIIQPHELRLGNVVFPPNRFTATYEGIPVDPELVGTPVPVVFGTNHGTLLINSNYLIFMSRPEPAHFIDAYDRGPEIPQLLTRDADVATPAELMAASIDGGHWVACPSFGLARVGGIASNSEIDIQSWALRDAPLFSGIDSSTAEAMRFIGQTANIAMNQADLDALRSEWPELVSLYIRNETEVEGALRTLADQVGMQWCYRDAELCLVPLALEPSSNPDHTLVFGAPGITGNRYLSDLVPPVDVQPYYTGWFHSVRQQLDGDIVEAVQTFFDNFALTDHPPAVADTRICYHRTSAGFARFVALWGSYLGRPWAVWTVTTGWDGTRYRAGETVAVTCHHWGLEARHMLIVAVDYVLRLPRRRKTKHALTVRLRLAEVRNGGN